jgi:hypothetical protein
MTRPRLALVSTNPSPVIGPLVVPLPKPRAVAQSIQAEAENLRVKLARALVSLTTDHSTDVALAQTRAELFTVAAGLQKLARKLPS